jgi:predicted pyridoxine 5'-phosphate oxidase superfamily flavin-nucleotide-binding protein
VAKASSNSGSDGGGAGPGGAAGPFHAGERAVQARVGVREQIERVGRRIVRDSLADWQRELFAELPYLVVGSLDRRGRPWASFLFGAPGFMSSPDRRRLQVDARPGAGDPLAGSLAVGAPVALLGIELETRRRTRLNGVVLAVTEGGFSVGVDQSFGNCPQYIQARTPIGHARGHGPTAGDQRAVRPEPALLSARAAEIVTGADTFFVATASAAVPSRADDPAQGVDVSHRGGRPGFVRVSGGGGPSLLTFPDFRGNFMFNTLGNLEVNPRAGLVFLDFASGELLALTGQAEIVWDGPAVEAFAGAERLVRFSVEEGVRIEGAVPLRWSRPEPAREVDGTGSWAAVGAAKPEGEREP